MSWGCLLALEMDGTSRGGGSELDILASDKQYPRRPPWSLEAPRVACRDLLTARREGTLMELEGTLDTEQRAPSMELRVPWTQVEGALHAVGGTLRRISDEVVKAHPRYGFDADEGALHDVEGTLNRLYKAVCRNLGTQEVERKTRLARRTTRERADRLGASEDEVTAEEYTVRREEHARRSRDEKLGRKAARGEGRNLGSGQFTPPLLSASKGTYKCVLPPQEVNRIGSYSSVKELWEKFLELHEGTSEAKLARRDILRNKLMNIQLEKSEKVASLHAMVKELITGLENLGETVTNRETIRYALNAFPRTSDWTSIVDAYYISKDLEVSTLEELFSTLELHETRCVGTTKEASQMIALNATKKDEPESDSEDDQEAYMCQKEGHLKEDCPELKKDKGKIPKKHKNLKATWDDTSSSESEIQEYVGIALMASYEGQSTSEPSIDEGGATSDGSSEARGDSSFKSDMVSKVCLLPPDELYFEGLVPRHDLEANCNIPSCVHLDCDLAHVVSSLAWTYAGKVGMQIVSHHEMNNKVGVDKKIIPAAPMSHGSPILPIRCLVNGDPHGLFVSYQLYAGFLAISICGRTEALRSGLRLPSTHVDPKSLVLLRHLRSTLSSNDPVSYLRNLINLPPALEHALRASLDSDKCAEWDNGQINHSLPDDAAIHIVQSRNSNSKNDGAIESSNCETLLADGRGFNHSDGRTFFLNRLKSIGPSTSDYCEGVSLAELLHPLKTVVRIFIATFTCDVSWFLSCFQVPNHLEITIACHNTERCWSADQDSRTSQPYVNYPNLLLVYPMFPDEIAFGKDRKKQGVACHHPKLIVLQRDESLRVIVTSANLVPKQVNLTCVTVWFQSSLIRAKQIATPDYSALFEETELKIDFAAQLAGFVASLLVDVPSQAHWINELSKYDFEEATCYLVASVPGIHSSSPCNLEAHYCLSAKQIKQCKTSAGNLLGSVQTTVVGLHYRFHTSFDPNGGQLKFLASLLRRCSESTSGTVEVLLKRITNIKADDNAVSIVVAADLGELCEGDFMQLGFLPRDVARWVSPLSDIGFFSFSAFIYPKEVIAAAIGERSMKIQLLINGSRFTEMPNLITPEHFVSLCLLVASLQRRLGLWRLREVLSQYRWPESLEVDFVYGASSIGASVDLPFFSAFAAAAGKKSCYYPDSEESDPEWGHWSIANELKRPSIKILFPTIERVKNGHCGIHSSRRLLSLSEKTWQRLKIAGIFHDAVPRPCERVGYPMHVKLAQRQFLSGNGMTTFGWIYVGSHNFSPAAWGRTLLPSSKSKSLNSSTLLYKSPFARSHNVNWCFGIRYHIYPCSYSQGSVSSFSLEMLDLPLVMPKGRHLRNDRPAPLTSDRQGNKEAQILKSNNTLILKDDSIYMVQPENFESKDSKHLVLVTSFGFKENPVDQCIYVNLMYAQVYTRPDIAFIVGMLGRYVSNPRPSHWKAAKRVMRYLQRTKGHMLTYHKSYHFETLVATSTMEAELVACYEASNHWIWLWNFIIALQIIDGIDKPLRIYCDNKAAELYAKNNRSTSKSKHIDIKFLAVKERVQSYQIMVEHISTDSMLVDPLTKGLVPKVFHVHVVDMRVLMEEELI
ncbi:hypothetical protein ZIOFF_035413 [Zingiber officinale]|uniref:HIRAN domain-containing protein n=1 Tax=Zingiber officinale TaxID=94328 RepID=A0A8J5KXN1_ZINOF|nr:hypothetical protein ZIOFF_035413 [Zingiber officinale]